MPLYSDDALIDAAIDSLSIKGDTNTRRRVSMYHRDGLVFECIVWIASWFDAPEGRLSLDPHLSSTTQGLDGLLIDWDDSARQVQLATIVEAKCSENPRSTFTRKVIPAFQDHEMGFKSRDVLAAAAQLLRQLPLNGSEAAVAAQQVLGPSNRAYNASFAVESVFNSDDAHSKMFAGYEVLEQVGPDRRIGDLFIVEGALRDWFENIARLAIGELEKLRPQRAGSGVSSV